MSHFFEKKPAIVKGVNLYKYRKEDILAGNKTNSNSLTAIFVSKLNYKKSAFRNEILELWNLPKDIIFKDGTHSICRIPEMENKEVDIVGMVDSKIIVLIEIKVGLNEDLQPSQEENGQYEMAAKNNDEVKLIYVIPAGYYHLSDLPKESEKVIITTWSEIFEFAKQFDNTGFVEQINYFVESNFYDNDFLFNKGDVAMFLSPSIIENVSSLRFKIKGLMDKFIETNEIIKFNEPSDSNLGYWYKIGAKKIEAWIGIGAVKNSKESFFIYIGETDIDKDKLMKFEGDYFPEKYGINFPIVTKDGTPPEFLFEETIEAQQKEFNKLMEYNINRLLKVICSS